MVKKLLTQFRYLAGLILIIFAAIILSPRDRSNDGIIFLTGANLSDIIRQISENGIIALGMTFVILTGGIDLSVGSVLALSASFAAKMLTQWQPGVSSAFHIFLTIFVTLVLTTGTGTAMGLVISRFNIQPFIVTLAGMIGLRGLARFITSNANIDLGFGDDVGSLFARYISPKPVIIFTFVFLAFVFWLVLSKTIFGLRVKAIGDNKKASGYAGLPVGMTLVFVYALSGLMTGIAGILHAAQNHQGNANDGMGYELDAIAAVVIGGTSLAGGKGSISGTIVGVLILGILTNMFRLRGIDINMEMMFKAVIIVVAVYIQMPKNKLATQVGLN